MNAATGRNLTGLDHLHQSIADILSTPIGTRVMRRDYGSRLPELIDAPMTPDLNIEIFAATAEALDRWEPRLRVTRVGIEEAIAGRLVLGLWGTYLVDGKPVAMKGIVIQ